MGHSQCWQEYVAALYLANDGYILCFTRHHFDIQYFNCYLAASSRSVDISIISTVYVLYSRAGRWKVAQC